MIKFEDLAGNFVNPPKEYKTAPLYVWNTEITKEIIDSTMLGLKKRGFGGVFIHPRPGLISEYISDKWYEMFRYTLDKGKELDMNVWIYDENSYPSGFAGGHVPAEMPESYDQGHGLSMKKFETLPDNASDFFICMKKENDTFKDITTNLETEKGKNGDYYLFSKTYPGKSPWYGGFSYVDLLYPGVTEKFIEITMNGYEKIAGDEFGKSMPGWFTDEPNIHSYGSTRWTPDLFDVFQKKWGYDLKSKLPLLFEETGNYQEVRHNYFQTLLQLFIDRWAKPCFEYCEARNLKFTGHYWEHGWPDMGHGPDNMAMYAWHQLPGIDMLFNQFNETSAQAQFGNIRSVKELSSVANQMGYKRTLSETYGGGGWEETFKDLKMLGDWEYALGVNFMNQHLSHLSIAGARKYDYPPTFSEHSPWWDHYTPLNMHYARLSMALSAGEQMNDILVLEPNTSIWLYYAYSGSNKRLWDIANAFQSMVTQLEKAQVEYDLGSENIIKDQGSVKKKKLVIGQRAYSTVVLPPFTENLDAPTFNFIRQFVKNGGNLLAFSKPERIEGTPNEEIKNFFNNNEKITYLNELTPEIIRKHFTSPDISFENIRGGNLFHHRRTMSDGYVLFLVNSDLDNYTSGQVSINGRDAVELETLTGKIIDYAETENGEKIKIDFHIPPAGSTLLYISNKKLQGFEMPHASGKYEMMSSVGTITASPVEKNVLTIDFCDLHLGNEVFADQHIYNAADRAFKHHGFTHGNPWSTSVQYKDNIVSRDTFKTGGFKAVYKFTVTGNFELSGIQAVVERPWLYRIQINGSNIDPEKEWWLDRDMRILNIGKYVKKGENLLTLELSPMKILAEIEPVYLLGNFSLEPAAKGWSIRPPVKEFSTGSWKEQGWPFYSRSVAYTKVFNVNDPSGNYRVRLGDFAGTVAEVSVNGKSAGIIGFEPYTINVSEFIRDGSNSIEVKIVGSNKNLLGPFHNNPRKGLTSPWDFRNVRSYPSGKDYHQFDYGLMDDFWLEKEN
jgi:hypothetical protein